MIHYEWGFADLLPYWPDLLAGAWLTLKLSAWATVFGFILGCSCAVARHSGPRWLQMVVGVYVEVIRNTPLLVQVFLVYFGIASLGIRVNANMAAVLALVVNVGAYTCEIVRAGIESVQRAQIEAGECLGLSPLQVYRYIVLAPAIERVYPALTGQYVMLMLASSITSQISAEELTAVTNRVQSDTFRAFEAYIVAWVVYLLLSFLVRLVFWSFGQFAFPRRRRLGTSL
jgi:polar amino acid transport system permease protein